MKPEVIQPNTYVALRLPSGAHSIVQVLPNTFQANHILGRPYYLTFEVLDKTENENENTTKSGLRIIPAGELYADIDDDRPTTPFETENGPSLSNSGGVQYDILSEDGQVVMRTNRQIIDDPNSQIMTMEEIEALKASGTRSGKELVAKMLESHSALDQKTAFALAKYTLRKTKKYLKRFTVLPLDVAMLAKWMLYEKDAGKIMELREEVLALVGSWSNIHYTSSDPTLPALEQISKVGEGRWLVVDETAGLLTAYMAEKMGTLYTSTEPQQTSPPEPGVPQPNDEPRDQSEASRVPDVQLEEHRPLQSWKSSLPSMKNSLTVVHPLSQPNLSLLRYFSFDPFNPPPTHPLTSHLKTISWLQLLDPSADSGYTEPPFVSEADLATWKSGKRSTYFRKRRRWERIKLIVDETRAGGFDGLVIASVMKPVSLLYHLIPLLRGAAPIVVYCPHLEPLAELADYYSTARKAAFITETPTELGMETEDFPVDPRLLLAPIIQTARARPWQVLPGRTHPLMTGRGGGEGYVFTATRVLPAEGKVEARGKFKRRKVNTTERELDQGAATVKAEEQRSSETNRNSMAAEVNAENEAVQKDIP
ncbi:MAG: hypothetical protein Q9217_002633 [Psora testacea]